MTLPLTVTARTVAEARRELVLSPALSKGENLNHETHERTRRTRKAFVHFASFRAFVFQTAIHRFERLRARQREAQRQAEHLFETLLHQAFRGKL